MAKKMSELDIYDCKSFLRIDFDEDDYFIEMALDFARGYVSSYTKRTIEDLDNIPEACMCVLILMAHFYDNRTLEASSSVKTSINYTIDKIMGTHWFYMSNSQMEGIDE